MIHRTSLIPDLPERWPYEPRTALPPLHMRKEADLPGLGSGWTLLASEHLELQGAAAPLDEAYGRGGVLRLGGLVLRPYRRGGLLRKLNPRLYASPGRFERELRLHRALWEAGFPTVEPAGCAFRRCGAGYEGVFLTRLVPGKPWPGTWETGGDVMPQLGRALKALDAWGVWAPDLNATNVHLGEDGVLRCLDWDRAAFSREAGVLLFRYRQRLEASLRRLNAPPGIRPALEAAIRASPG